jgi:hypothetical protein
MVERPFKWHEHMSEPEYMNQLIYRIEKAIPGVVQKVLEELGFVEWDAAVHAED